METISTHEAALRESEERYRALMEHAPEAIVVLDLATGRFDHVNENAVRLFRLPREELLKLGPADLSPPTQPDGRPSAQAAAEHLREAAAGRTPVFEWTHRAGDIDIPCEVRLVRLPSSQGVLIRGSITDISERKRAEHELRRSNAELEQFARVASHDLAEPLHTIAGFAELIERHYGDRLGEEGRLWLGRLQGGVERMRVLIDDLLSLSRAGREPVRPQLVAAGDVVATVVGLLDAAIRETSARVEARDLPVVRADRGQLVQVFQNLIANAIKFRGPDPPEVIVRAERKGDGWCFAVEDNGVGIHPADAERVFGMFQRAPGVQQRPGTGIGLAICRRIVERHGGRIWVESEPGHGATFAFTIPAQEEAMAGA